MTRIDKLTDYLNTKGFSCLYTDNYLSVQNYTNTGEEFYEDLEGATTEELENNARDLYDNFDVGEHFKLWYGANRGEPSDPRELLKGCEEYEEMLELLYNSIKEFNEKNTETREEWFKENFDIDYNTLELILALFTILDNVKTIFLILNETAYSISEEETQMLLDMEV